MRAEAALAAAAPAAAERGLDGDAVFEAEQEAGGEAVAGADGVHGLHRGGANEPLAAGDHAHCAGGPQGHDGMPAPPVATRRRQVAEIIHAHPTYSEIIRSTLDFALDKAVDFYL